MGHKYSLPESITQAITISQRVNEGGLSPQGHYNDDGGWHCIGNKQIQWP